jgi:L-rhamnose isomerase
MSKSSTNTVWLNKTYINKNTRGKRMSIWNDQGYKDGRADALAGRDRICNEVPDIISSFICGNSETEYRKSYSKAYDEAKK